MESGASAGFCLTKSGVIAFVANAVYHGNFCHQALNNQHEKTPIPDLNLCSDHDCGCCITNVRPAGIWTRPNGFDAPCDAATSGYPYDGAVDAHGNRRQQQFFGGPATPTAGFNQGYLGPTIVMQNGDLAAKVQNNLDEPINAHWHGLTSNPGFVVIDTIMLRLSFPRAKKGNSLRLHRLIQPVLQFNKELNEND